MEQPNTFSTRCLQCVRCTISPNRAGLFTMIFRVVGTTCTAISSITRESFHDLATANGYRLIFQEISLRRWRQTPSALRDAGFADRKFCDYGIEIVFQKTTDASFKIPVDNISSAVVSEAAWTSGETNVAVSPVLPVDPKTLLARMPFRTVHAAYWSRVKDIIFENFGFRR